MLSFDVFARLVLELFDAEVDEPVVEVFAAEVRVAIRGLDLDDALVHGQQRYIEGATTKIENEHIFLVLEFLRQPVSKGSSIRLTDDSERLQVGNRRGVNRSLALRVVEVRRHRDHCFRDLVDNIVWIFVKESLSCLLQLLQNEGGYLLSLIVLVFVLELDFDHGLLAGAWLHGEGPVLEIVGEGRIIVLHANESLRPIDGVLGIAMRLVDGGLPDELAVLSERDLRRRGRLAVLVVNDLDFVISPHADT